MRKILLSGPHVSWIRLGVLELECFCSSYEQMFEKPVCYCATICVQESKGDPSYAILC